MRHRSAAIEPVRFSQQLARHSGRLAVFKTIGEKPFEVPGFVDIQCDALVFEKANWQSLRCHAAHMEREAVIAEAQLDHVGRRQEQRIGAETIVRRHEQSEWRPGVVGNLR